MLLEVLNPVAQLQRALTVRTVSSRPASLQGKTVGLLASGRTNSDVALKRVAENLQRKFPSVNTRFYIEHQQPWPKDLPGLIAQQCDMVVIASAD
jgi:hypothetical protein